MANEIVRQMNIQNVLQQAMELFTEKGIENTSMEMIARASDLTLRSIQNYFHTRNDLYVSLLKRNYALELEEMKDFFGSKEYQSKTGAEQVISIISASLNEAIEHADTVFCTVQMQHILSRTANEENPAQLTGNWLYLMDRLKGAFAAGIADGSISQAMENELIDVHTIMLALIGIHEQVAYALTNTTLHKLFTPEETVKKYIRQIEALMNFQNGNG